MSSLFLMCWSFHHGKGYKGYKGFKGYKVGLQPETLADGKLLCCRFHHGNFW